MVPLRALRWEPGSHRGAFGDSPVTSCPAVRVLSCPASPSTRPRLCACHNGDIVWAGGGGGFCMKKPDFVTTTGPLCAGAPPSVAWGGCGAVDVKAWGERRAALRVPLSTDQSPVMPGWPGGTRVLVRCRLGTALPQGLVLSRWDTLFWLSLEEGGDVPSGVPC